MVKLLSVASGSKNSQGYTNNSGSYGLFLPDTSTVLLNGAALDANSGTTSLTGTNGGLGINLGTVTNFKYKWK